MKKIISALLIVLLAASMSGPAASAEDADTLVYSVSAERVDLSAGGTGSFTITVPYTGVPYNSVNFVVSMPAGGEVSSVSYSPTGASELPPQVPPGGQQPNTWYFACYVLNSSPKLASELTCTVNVVYTGSAAANLTIREITKSVLDGHTTDNFRSNRTAAVTLVPSGGAVDPPAPGQSSDATLSSLTISPGALTPAFSPNTTAYTATVANSVASVTVSARPNHAGASVSGTGGHAVNVGTNVIEVAVIAQNGTTKKTYAITVTRQDSSPGPGGGGTGGSQTGTGTGTGTGVDPGGATTSITDESTALAGTLPFTDVTASDWFYGDVRYVWENSLMQGLYPSLFSPYMVVSRGMVVTVLWRNEGSPGASGLANTFTDVPAGQWYTDAVKWAADKKIVEGYPSGQFAPDLTITREQLAAILYRHQQSAQKAPPDIVADREFADWNSISSYAKAPVNKLVMQGIISGRPGNIFDPLGIAHRAEFAAMLHRYLGAV